MATPLTVCLVVLGKHVPGLEFVGMLMADTPALAAAAAGYRGESRGLDAAGEPDVPRRTRGDHAAPTSGNNRRAGCVAGKLSLTKTALDEVP
jgi:hypothetical protein